MLYLQDWLTLKVLKAKNTTKLKLKTWDKVVYQKNWQKFIATNIWYECEVDYEVVFLYKLNERQLERFYNLNNRALEIFKNIKNELKIVFPQLRFVTSKFNYIWDIIYLYFYSEERIDFRPYLWELKKLIWEKFFLYQVWARDRIRLDERSKDICWDCWYKLCCTKSMCKIDSVSTSSIHLQNLQNQGIENQKWVCGKLKCCLKYEENIYKKEDDN